MTPAQFRALALGLPGASEGAHMGHSDFRVGGKIFASLGYPDAEWAMVKLTPEMQEMYSGGRAHGVRAGQGSLGAARQYQCPPRGSDQGKARRCAPYGLGIGDGPAMPMWRIANSEQTETRPSLSPFAHPVRRDLTLRRD